MPPFQINVGRQPQGKQGALMHKHADGTLRDVQFNLSWPSLTVTARGGEALNGDEIVKNSVVRPLCNMDGPVQGRNGFCFQCTLKSKTLTFFAASPQDRDAWCVALRNHAAHHNLANAFEVSSRVLGTGAYAKVLAGKCKVTGAPVALKIIPRSRIDSTTHPAAERTLLSTEMQLGMELRHELCTKTIEFIENAHQYVIVMELMGGGDLFEFLRRRSLTEGEVQCLMRQVLVGLQYMHSRNIGHFDLKPENLLLSQEKPMTVKLCDFGISLDLKRSQPSCYKTPGMLRATPGYGAPEVVKQQTCGLKADLWSLGACLYFFLTGKMPFIGGSAQDTQNRMASGQYDKGALARCNPNAADLVARMLTVDMSRRISAAEALNHPWLRMGPHDGEEAAAPQAGGCGLCADPYRGRAFRNPNRGLV